MANYDVVVMGGGHNQLGTAAYLAKAGKKVLVLEKKDFTGGGAVTLGAHRARLFCTTSIRSCMG